MFEDIRKFVKLQSTLDCINSYKPLTFPKDKEEKNYYIDQSICLSDIQYNDF
jgi:hypothetical protein